MIGYLYIKMKNEVTMKKRLLMTVSVLLICPFLSLSAKSNAKTISFSDDFEKGAGQWEFFEKVTMTPLPAEGRIVDSGDKEHGKVLSLPPGELIALVKNSDGWTGYSVEGDVYFPATAASLMGLVYNLNLVPRSNWKGDTHKTRTEFGSMYIKCGGGYIRVNPHYDGTAGRALHDDYKTPLYGKAAVALKKWTHFKFEVAGGACHLYVEDMKKPQVTFNHYHNTSGRVGLRPRSAGSQCWVDNIKIKSIAALSFKGHILPEGVTHDKEKLITNWYAAGPLYDRLKEIETAPFNAAKTINVNGRAYRWRKFETDHRGCVISGKINDFIPHGRKLAYFHTTVSSKEKRETALRFSSRSFLTVFVNGKEAGKIKPVIHIWPDFWNGRRHVPTGLNITLKKGVNHILVLVDGGKYPGDGFYVFIDE
jgi:hypothetical protein